MIDIQTTILASAVTLILVLLYHISTVLEPTIATVAAIFWVLNSIALVVNVLCMAFAPLRIVFAAGNYFNMVVLSTYLDANGWTFA